MKYDLTLQDPSRSGGQSPTLKGGPKTEYLVLGMPTDEEARVVKTDGFGWQIERTRQGIVSPLYGDYETAEMARVALELEINAH